MLIGGMFLVTPSHGQLADFQAPVGSRFLVPRGTLQAMGSETQAFPAYYDVSAWIYLNWVMAFWLKKKIHLAIQSFIYD